MLWEEDNADNCRKKMVQSKTSRFLRRKRANVVSSLQRIGWQKSLKNLVNFEKHDFVGKANLNSVQSLLDSQLPFLQLNRARIDSLDE